MDGVDRLPGEIAQALERGATVVTGNQRATRTLQHAFNQQSRARGLASWRLPSIMAWETWASGLWHEWMLEGRATAMLLNGTQEHAIWRSLLSADVELSSLREVDSLATLAADAWRLLCRHNGQRRLRNFSGNTDTRAFERWAQEFERRCRAEDLLPSAQMEDAIRAALQGGAVDALPPEIALVGFDGMTPAQEAVVEAVRAAGIVIGSIELTAPAQQRVLARATDEIGELYAAARWIRRYLEDHPAARIAVIVPDLEARRARIDRAFREVLAPELENIAANDDAAPYEFSLGVPLARTPMIEVALDLLRWSIGALPLTQVSALLLSPYFAPAEGERGGRAEFDAFAMRQEDLLRPEVTIGWLLECIEGWKRNGKISRLLKAVRKMERVAEERLASRERRSFAAWTEVIGEFLDAAAWGAGRDTARGESSLEFQARRKWERVLDELARLDFNAGRVEFRQALGRLEWIARETMFAAESREAPVQVMGPLEAAGSRFDAAWFLGAGELSWPRGTGSNPLLPWHLQRELGMPGVDPERDDAQARLVTRRIAESAETVVFSYAVEAAEGHQRASAALKDIEMEEVVAEEFAPVSAERQIVELETVEDSDSLPLRRDEVMRGGADILKLQAACGFRAFAEKRLWSTELEHAELGLDAAGRGNIVHRALELFWKQVESQVALKKMTASEFDGVLDQSISEALRKAAELSKTAWDAAYVEVQRARLRSLMEQWLELERGRAPFTVKLSEREFKDVRIGPLRLDVRVDRVDEGEQGEILIDYKTGVAKPADWLGERPEAPQLPLYAMLTNAERLEAVAFAQVRTGKEMTLTGYATSADALTKSVKLTEAATLEEQVEQWREVLTKLATDFYNGDARVNPKNYPKTCEHCRQRILCRLDPASVEDDAEENDAAEAEHV